VPAARLPRRAAAARRAVLLGGALSRRAGIGGGSTVGGHLGLALEPRLLSRLGAGRRIALVSGTNGKTTTTRLLVEALGGSAVVASSLAGANMAAGIVSALASHPAPLAALEVDEGHLPAVAAALAPQVIALLNLSRDQLDRTNEVRMLAGRWREALAGSEALVVANADDPLVVFAAEVAAKRRFVSVGGRWRLDARHCPHCGGTVVFAEDGSWSCACGFRRPEPYATLVDDALVLSDGSTHRLAVALPGRFNQANAAVAAVAAECLGVALDDALAAIGGVEEVAGRFARHRSGDVDLRLLLAKNPAGWAELLELLTAGEGPVVIGINARDADGHDPSWLYDVPFELLAGREVVATGERARDLALRLLHAGVAHRTLHDQAAALAALGAGRADYVGNYTAFQELRRLLAGPSRRAAASAPLVAARPVVAHGATRDSAVRVVVVHPELLGTYGDGGNGQVLADRALWRGLDVELLLAPAGEPLPRGELYLLGGGEDGPQAQAAAALRSGALASAVEAGAAVFAVCAGFQILGHSFPGADGAPVTGVGLLDVVTERGTTRAVGELATEADLGGVAVRLTGFENHAGHTTLGEGVRPLGVVGHGTGNGASGVDGAWQDKVLGSYLHGPALARNPALADALLALATGGVLAPLDDAEEEALRAERFAALGRRGRGAQKSGRAHGR